jgi:integrase
LLGWAGAFRRSELVALDVRDLAFTDEGLEVTIRKSKTDQQRVGRKIGIPLSASPSVCPVQAVRAWLDLAGIASGPVLRAVNRHGQVSSTRLTGHSVALIVKAHAKRLGLDPTLYAGHSLRAGFATSAAKAGKSEASIALQTGHKSMTMLRKYVRNASLFENNAGRGLL